MAVVDPVHAEPFHLSNQLSSLDRVSRGRAGWWLDVVDDAAHARAHGSAHQFLVPLPLPSPGSVPVPGWSP